MQSSILFRFLSSMHQNSVILWNSVSFYESKNFFWNDYKWQWRLKPCSVQFHFQQQICLNQLPITEYAIEGSRDW